MLNIVIDMFLVVRILLCFGKKLYYRRILPAPLPFALFLNVYLILFLPYSQDIALTL